MKALKLIQEMVDDKAQVGAELEKIGWSVKDDVYSKRVGDATINIELSVDAAGTMWAEGGLQVSWSYETARGDRVFNTEHDIDPIKRGPGTSAADFAAEINDNVSSGVPTEPPEYPDDAVGYDHSYQKGSVLDRF